MSRKQEYSQQLATSVRLDRAVDRALRKQAKKESRSISNMIHVMLREGLNKRGAKLAEEPSANGGANVLS